MKLINEHKDIASSLVARMHFAASVGHVVAEPRNSKGIQ
jgi:hypothetical protein